MGAGAGAGAGAGFGGAGAVSSALAINGGIQVDAISIPDDRSIDRRCIRPLFCRGGVVFAAGDDKATTEGENSRPLIVAKRNQTNIF